MGRFRSADSQAKHVVKQKLALGKPSHAKEGGDGRIHGLGTARTYSDSLRGVATFIAEYKLDPEGRGLASLTKETAQTYLEFRSQLVGQKQLDKDRQAMQMVLGEKLATLKSELDQALQCRAYTHSQIQLIAEAQTSKHSLPSRIAADAGLRAHELLTLLPIAERGPTEDRTWSDELFKGRVDVMRYSVEGKGGLIRGIALARVLSEQLEALRLAKPRTVTDRGIYYQQFYKIGGGKQWSDSFSKAAFRELGWSNGAHGVRHTYAQNRMRALLSLGCRYAMSLSIVSQEMGHFRPNITEVYLR